MDKVDDTMASIQEQRDIANEIAEAISNPVNMGIDLDEVSHWDYLWLMIFVLMFFIGRAQGRTGGIGAGNPERAVERSKSCASASTANIHEAERE